MSGHLFYILSFSIYFATFTWHLLALGFNKPAWQKITLTGIWSGFVLHTLGMGLTIFETGHFLAANSSEAYAFLSWMMVLLHLLISIRYRVSFLSLFTLPLVLFLMLASHLAAGESTQQLLTGYWLKLHIALTFVAYSAFALACVAGLGYLMQDKQLKSHHPGKVFRWLPSLGVLEEINTRALVLGLLMLTLGLLSGFFWVRSAAVTDWLADPKVSCAVMIWLLYAFLILMRLTSKVRGKKVAFVSVFGFALVIVTFIGVNHTVLH